ncbi:MAG: 5-formyltetrahydrofolate cyclo-ligase [Bacilli bacterium]|nr:5-formyltetrahydrofolate cyclo-ligase [Bacilli bacterium]
MDKIEARRHFKQLRRAVVDKQSKSFLILEKVFPLIEDKETICLYYPLNDEVDTKPLIEKLLTMGKKVGLPATKDDSIEFYLISSLRSLKSNEKHRFLKEPMEDETQKIPPNDIDVIICPGIAFDKTLHRLGYGGGYYDKYLKSLNCLKIGICFKELYADEIPYEAHDVLMDVVIVD